MSAAILNWIKLLRLKVVNGIYSSTIAAPTLTANRNLVVPDSSGTFALTTENEPFLRDFKTIRVFEDWIGSDIRGTIGWNTGVANTGTAGVTSSISNNNNQGVIGLATQSNAAGRASIYTADFNGAGCGFFLDGVIKMRWVINISTLAAIGSNEFFIKIGLSNNVSSATEGCLNGLLFSYKATSSLNWEIIATKAGSETKITTNIPVVANKWVVLDMSFDGTNASFSINNTSIGTISNANLPINTTTLGLHARLVKTLGTSNRALYIDKCFFTRN